MHAGYLLCQAPVHQTDRAPKDLAVVITSGEAMRDMTFVHATYRGIDAMNFVGGDQRLSELACTILSAVYVSHGMNLSTGSWWFEILMRRSHVFWKFQCGHRPYAALIEHQRRGLRGVTPFVHAVGILVVHWRRSFPGGLWHRAPIAFRAFNPP